MPPKEGMLGVFTYVDDVLLALVGLKEEHHRIEAVYSPLRLPEVEEALGKKPSRVRLITLVGGICGGLGVVGLAVYAHLSFSLITGGKPVLPWIPWVVVLFEGTILGAVLSSVVAWILKGRLPRLRPATVYDVRFSQDCFGVLVACVGKEQEEVRRLLDKTGAGEVRHVVW